MPTSTPLKSLILVTFSLLASLALAQQPTPAQAGAAKPPESKTHKLTRAEFDQLLAHPEQLLIVDIRRPDEVTAIGGLPVYLSIQLADLEKNLAWIPRDRKIVTVSNHSVRAGRAGDLLAAKGFNVVGQIGVQNYEADGGTLTKIAPRVARGAEPQKGAQTTAQAATSSVAANSK
jgi:rhodanese-related sulfurtransferase